MTLREQSKTVQDYKIEQADKFSLGMAINNAAILIGNRPWNDEGMKATILRLFKLYNEIRKEELGY